VIFQSFSSLTINTDERRVGIPLKDLTPPYLYACPKIVSGFPTKYRLKKQLILNYERIV
jgi:hypothetical protein